MPPFLISTRSFVFELMASEFPHAPQVKPTHFFKIIHDQSQSILEGKLEMPRKFVEKYGEGLPETIFLKPPNGATWNLNLLKRDGKIWFQQGWKQFVESHSLAHGHLLVFRYEGTSHFHVHIFDTSGLEIKYPFKKVEAQKAFKDQGNERPDGENSEDYRAGEKRKATSSLEFLQPCKIGSSGCVKIGNTLKLQKEALHRTNKKCKGKQVITAKKVTALDRASSFKTCNPSFFVVMHPSYVKEHFVLNLPYEFGKRHFDFGKKSGDIHLRVLNGRVWPTKYLFWKSNSYTKFALSSGWKAFVKDNNLKVGDVCTFELMTQITFQVHIFRETGNSTFPTSQESGKKRATI